MKYELMNSRVITGLNDGKGDMHSTRYREADPLKVYEQCWDYTLNL